MLCGVVCGMCGMLCCVCVLGLRVCARTQRCVPVGDWCMHRATCATRGGAALYCLQDDSKLYKNNEISNLIVGLGLGLKGEELPNLRYGKVRGCKQGWWGGLGTGTGQQGGRADAC